MKLARHDNFLWMRAQQQQLQQHPEADPTATPPPPASNLWSFRIPDPITPCHTQSRPATRPVAHAQSRPVILSVLAAEPTPVPALRRGGPAPRLAAAVRATSGPGLF